MPKLAWIFWTQSPLSHNRFETKPNIRTKRSVGRHWLSVVLEFDAVQSMKIMGDGFPPTRNTGLEIFWCIIRAYGWRRGLTTGGTVSQPQVAMQRELWLFLVFTTYDYITCRNVNDDLNDYHDYNDQWVSTFYRTAANSRRQDALCCNLTVCRPAAVPFSVHHYGCKLRFIIYYAWRDISALSGRIGTYLRDANSIR